MVEVQKDNHELREKLQRLNQMMHAREEEIANVLAKHASPNSSDYPSLSSLPPMPSSSPPPPPVVASPEKKKGRGGMFYGTAERVKRSRFFEGWREKREW
jgi:hypothetical protein